MPDVTPSATNPANTQNTRNAQNTSSTAGTPNTGNPPASESRRPTTPLEKARAAVQARTAADPGTTTDPGTKTAETKTAETKTPAGTTAPARAGTGDGHGSPLLPADESDALGSRMQHAVVGFVDGPRDAVAEADHVLEELTARFTDAVNQRRRTLRGSWQSAEAGGKGETATTTDTEQLRLALRDYRELTERLLHI
ncbi:hypothetical protein [Streptomyces sp. NPDC002588]|uniref:hypothetical protein n=1 Tax=Streptomyces sp. NPDC002588 TaxID=3154419 RepID=UPI003329B1EE